MKNESHGSQKPKLYPQIFFGDHVIGKLKGS